MGCCTSALRNEKYAPLPEIVEVEAWSKTEDGFAANSTDQERHASDFTGGYCHTKEGCEIGLGSYEVYGIDVPVMALASASSEQVASLQRGTVVDVVGLCCRGEPLVFWGRIESPDGWIPLRHVDSRLGQWVRAWSGTTQGAVASSGGHGHAQVETDSHGDCDQVLCGLEGMVAVMSCSNCQQEDSALELPETLRVESPNGQHSCEGGYVLVPEELPHGYPCWRLSPNGSRWLYSTKSGIWCIGGGDVNGEQFGRSAGFIFQGEAHLGRLPHEHDAPWHRWDGKAFVVDTSITVVVEELEVKPALPTTGTDLQSRDVSEASTAVPPGPVQRSGSSQEFSPVCTEPSQPFQETPMAPPPPPQPPAEPSLRDDDPAKSSYIEVMDLDHPGMPTDARVDVERRWHPGMPKPEPKMSVAHGVIQSEGQPWSLNCCYVQPADMSHNNRLLRQDSPPDVRPSPRQWSLSEASQSPRHRPERSETSSRRSRSSSVAKETAGIGPIPTAYPRLPQRSPLGSPREKGAFPVVLCIESPNVHTSCAGFYVLVAGARPNGRPLWKKRGARRWLYTGTDGRWYVGGPSSSKRKFKCEAGYLCHQGDYESGRPDRLQGPWSWGDAEAWYPDAEIAVRFAENFELRPLPDRIKT